MRAPLRLATPFVVVTLAVVAAHGVLAACDSRPVRPLDPDEEPDAGDRDASFAPPPVELGRHAVRVLDTRRVVPSPGLPAEAPVQTSNNNLDVVRFEGRVYLAWRTAPDHFASDKTQMVLASSADETTWKLERIFTAGTDLREPRFLVLGGKLFFYTSLLGTDPVKFEPKGIAYSQRGGGGSWTDLAPVLRTPPDASPDAGAGDAGAGDAGAGDAGAGNATPMTGYIAWRTKQERGRPFMSAYLGGEHIYQFDGLPLDVELLTTDDGITWRGANPARPVVSRGGGSEMDFTLGDDGRLFAIVRNEAGDETGWGSKVCTAPAGDVSAWSCKHDPKKYDSPLVFWHDGEGYLVGRRNVSETGNYDLGTRDPNPQQTTLAFQIDYRKHAKRCSLWRWVQGEDRIAYVLDLPSRGDTCFASKLDGATPTQIVLYNYSSDVDGADVSWAEGQIGPTYVYRHVLELTPR